MDDIDSSSSDEEDIEVEGENLDPPKDAPLACPVDPTAPLISQKRTHESSSSDSDKETPPSMQNSLQVIPVQLAHNGWVTVSKKKGKNVDWEILPILGRLPSLVLYFMFFLLSFADVVDVHWDRG